MSSSEPLESAQEAIDEAKQAAGQAQDTDLLADPEESDVTSSETDSETDEVGSGESG